MHRTRPGGLNGGEMYWTRPGSGVLLLLQLIGHAARLAYFIYLHALYYGISVSMCCSRSLLMLHSVCRCSGVNTIELSAEMEGKRESVAMHPTQLIRLLNCLQTQ